MADLIDRDEAMKAIGNYLQLNMHPNEHGNIDTAMYILAGIIPRRANGKWLPLLRESKKYFYCCSNCFFEVELGWNFCPHCGADMRGGRAE